MMAKGKRKNTIILVFLALVLVVLLGIYFWYDNNQKSKESIESEEEQSITLALVDTTQVESLHYVKGNTDLTFVSKDDVWIEQTEEERPINQERISTIFDAIKEIKANRLIIESPEDLSDYGLEQPQAVLRVKMKDQSVVTVKIGDKAMDSSGYYGLVNSDNIVYLLSTQLGSALQYNDMQMTALPEAPSITASNITHILIDNRTGEDYELLYSEEKQLDNTGSNMNAWRFLKPYGEGYTADTSKVSDLLENYTTFRYLNCVDYKGEDLARYGLEDPVSSLTIGYYESRTEALPTPETDPDTGEEITEKTYKDPYEYKIDIGDQDGEGNYYVKLGDSNAVYTMSSDTVDTILQLDSFGILNPHILIPSLEHVEKIEVQVGGTTYRMSIDHKTSTDSDGNKATSTTYTFNNKTSDEDAFKTLYQQLIGITYDAQIPNDVIVYNETPYLTLTYYLLGDNERTVSASFLPYDDNFYMVKKKDDTYFFVDKRSIDDITKALSSFTWKAKE